MHRPSSILTPSGGHLILLYSPTLSMWSDGKFTISPWNPFDYLPPLKLTLFFRYIASYNLCTFIFFLDLNHTNELTAFLCDDFSTSYIIPPPRFSPKFSNFSFYGYHSHKVFKPTQQSGLFPWNLFQFFSLTLTQQSTLDGLTSTEYHRISIL